FARGMARVTSMADIFISYANEDRDTARKLAAELEARGWSVWWDRKIQAGQSFDQVIEWELETARRVVVLWEKNSISSEWVKNEAALAAERGVLVPALIDSVRPPLEFRCRQAADLVGLATGDQDGTIRIWSLSTGQPELMVRQGKVGSVNPVT